MNKEIPKNPFKFGVYISKKHKIWVVLGVLAVIIATALDRFSVVIFKNLTDSITANPISYNSLWFWALAYPVLLFASKIAWRSSGFAGILWFENLRASAFQTLYEYLTLHSKDYFNNRFAGALTNKISNAVDGTQYLFENILWKYVQLFTGLILYVIIAWSSDFRLGAIIAIWSSLFLLINVYFAKKIHPLSYVAAESRSVLKGKLVDSLSNISLVHEYSYIDGERNYIKRFVNKSRDAGIKSWRFSEIIIFINGIFISLFVLAMIVVAVYLFQNHLVSIGVVIMTLAIVADLSSTFVFLAQEMKDTAANYGQAKEGLEEILTEYVITDAPAAKSLEFSKGEISIENMDFDYENTKVFENFSLIIPAGQKIGFVGRSGAGKTTFVSLLLRHFDVKSGAIKIDGQNIFDVKLESLRRAIAFVPQDTSLFHRSIKENISYSNPKATEDEVKKAAKLAQADEFIQKLPHGYDTLVGERGVKLSGGQRQRVSIARAFLKNSPILILDEATSSLDSESESAIQTSLDALMKDRTVIAIAHRLSTLKKMDRIVIIENGKIIEDGSPEELLEKPNGHFKKMWEHQVSGFIIEE